MKFLVDMPLSPGLAVWLRQRGHDAVHASELGLHRSADIDITTRARHDGRTVSMADLDYPQLLATTKAIEPSIVLFRAGDWSDDDVTARMSDVLAALPDDAIAQSIVVVERDRIRRRRLPLAT